MYNTVTNALLAVGSDKYLHLLVSLLLGFLLTLLLGWAWGAALAFFVGFLKETLVDVVIRYSTVDFADLAADALGVLIGVVMALF